MSPLNRGLALFVALTSVNPIFGQYGCGDDDVCYHGQGYPLPNVTMGGCYRECEDIMTPRTCLYEFNLELYQTMGDACGRCGVGVTKDCYNAECVQANGVQKGVLTINRQFPGTAIEVCRGDTIIVDVKNGMTGYQETIHWHGFLQKGTPWMDGVPMVTQCPIPFPTDFRYQFLADEAGTFFYHSHAGMHKVDGINGPLVVRQNKRYEVNGNTYDKDLSEHSLFLNDWLNYDSAMYVPGLNFPYSAPLPDSILINGRGRGNTTLGSETVTPYSVFRVRKGLRYRFRMVNSGSLICPILVTIQGHPMLIISTDKDPVKPKLVNGIVLYTGERYDFVLNANQAVGSYWITARAVGVCTSTINPAIQLAILQYDGSNSGKLSAEPRYNATLPTALMNYPARPCYDFPEELCVHQLQYNGRAPSNWMLYRTPDITHFINMGFVEFDPLTFFKLGTYNIFRSMPGFGISAGHMNNNSMIFPPSPLLTQHVMPERLCTDTVRPDDCPGDTFCECTYILSFPCNKIVEIILIDAMDPPEAPPFLDHPMHLHGYAFYVMGSGKLPPGEITNESVKKLYRDGKLPYVNHIPPLKDTVSVPQHGYTIIRFYTDNPGFWFFHCHFQFHMVVGMEMVFEVKECPYTPTPLQKPPCFPTCGNYKPELDYVTKSQIYP